jgi:hypothetical protein
LTDPKTPEERSVQKCGTGFRGIIELRKEMEV